MADQAGNTPQSMYVAVQIVSDYHHVSREESVPAMDAGGPAEAVYGVSESRSNECRQLSWLLKLVCLAVSHLTSTGPVFLFMDGHHSHITL